MGIAERGNMDERELAKWLQTGQGVGPRCHDCGAKEGEFHKLGCDMDICTHCNGQLISCDCFGVFTREPFFERPNICARCGRLYPSLNMVSKEEWAFICGKTFPEAHDRRGYGVLLCQRCMSLIKAARLKLEVATPVGLRYVVRTKKGLYYLKDTVQDKSKLQKLEKVGGAERLRRPFKASEGIGKGWHKHSKDHSDAAKRGLWALI